MQGRVVRVDVVAWEFSCSAIWYPADVNYCGVSIVMLIVDAGVRLAGLARRDTVPCQAPAGIAGGWSLPEPCNWGSGSGKRRLLQLPPSDT